MKNLSVTFRRSQIWFRKRFGQEFKVQAQRMLQRYGSDYGGWTLDPKGLSAESIVYSFGVGNDVTFDLALIEAFGCSIYAFDPTPRSIAWIDTQDLPPQFHFFDYGIASYDGEALFNPPSNPKHVSYTVLAGHQLTSEAVLAPVYRLQTIMNNLGHSRLNLLKLDVEGAEYAVLSQIDLTKVEIDQILVEFHHRFPTVGLQLTQGAVRLLKKQGFETAFVSASGDEFSFVRTRDNVD